MAIFYRLLIIISFISTNLYSQDHAWWAANVGWNGYYHFQSYLSLKPAHMGPNAFFLPSGLDSQIDTNSYLQITANSHFTKGEVTVNPFITWNINFGPRASLQISGAPIEYFDMTHELKTERKIFHLNYNDHIAAGDVRFLFSGQLMRNPDMAIYVGLKTASGTKVGAARFTDTPQYFFNYSVGFGSPKSRIYGSAGFTAWQTYDFKHNQDDGYTYGIGYLRKLSDTWTFKPEVYGIIAYLKDGDRPMIVSMELTKKLNHGELCYYIKQGIFDFPFTNIGFGYKHIW